MGVDSLPKRQEVNQVRFMESYTLEEVGHTHMVPINPIVMRAVVTTTVQDDGLNQEMRKVVDLMKNLSLSLLNNSRNNFRGRFTDHLGGMGNQVMVLSKAMVEFGGKHLCAIIVGS